jgi:hypothetical protein
LHDGINFQQSPPYRLQHAHAARVCISCDDVKGCHLTAGTHFLAENIVVLYAPIE